MMHNNSSLHLLVAPVELMRPGIGRNASCVIIFREIQFTHFVLLSRLKPYSQAPPYMIFHTFCYATTAWIESRNEAPLTSNHADS